jgi:hypothetical protein
LPETIQQAHLSICQELCMLLVPHYFPSGLNQLKQAGYGI